MITLSFGFKKPETGDTGDIVFPALEGNIQQLNDHTHDGSDTAKITTGSITPLTIDLDSGDWVADVNGLSKQTVVLPGALSYDTTAFTVKFLDTLDIVYPTIEKVSASSYDIYTNDASRGFKVLYL